MTARKRQYTQTDIGAWAANSGGINVALERNGLLTRLDVTAEITPSGALAAANQPDGLFRVIQNTTIRGGSQTYATLPAANPCGGGVLLHYMNRLDFRMAGHGPSSITAPNRTYNPITFRYHFGSRPRTLFGTDNPFDLTAFIPSVKESGLNFIIVTSGNDVMDDVTTISSGTYRFTQHIVQGTDGEIREEMAAQGVQYPGMAPMGMVPAWSSELFSHTATASDYATERDVPTGAYLKRIAIIEQDDTATRAIRAADQVTAVQLRLPLQSEALVRTFVDALQNSLDWGSNLQADSAAGNFQNSAPVGLIFMDLRPHGNFDYGLNLMPPIQNGQVKLGFTISTYTSGDASLILYERLQPNPSNTLV